MFDHHEVVFSGTKKKPPIGLIPEKMWMMERQQEIRRAINRYLVSSFPVPVEWVEEYNELKEKTK